MKPLHAILGECAGCYNRHASSHVARVGSERKTAVPVRKHRTELQSGRTGTQSVQARVDQPRPRRQREQHRSAKRFRPASRSSHQRDYEAIDNGKLTYLHRQMDSPAGYSSLKMPNVCLLGRRWIILWLLSDLLLGGSAFSPVLSRLQRSHSSLFTSLLDIQDERLEQIGRATFQSHFSFPLDDWQCRAGGAISEGSNVIVCAPTGAGKV